MISEAGKLTKRQMIERLMFSKNLQIAIRCCQLVSGEITEQDVKGMFLDAVCRDDYKEALMRADDHNKAALMAKDFTIGLFRFTMPDTHGYVSGNKYYLKISTRFGYVEISPDAITDSEIMRYKNFNKMFESWQPV